MSTITKTFAAIGSTELFKAVKDKIFSYQVSGFGSGTLLLKRSLDGGKTFENVNAVGSITANTNGIIAPDQDAHYKWECTVYGSGSIVARLDDANFMLNSIPRSLTIPASGLAKVGGTSGWVVAAADNLNLVTLPASQTGSKLILPVTGLRLGDVITGFSLVGQIESGGNAVTIDADLRKQIAVAADVSDASIGAMTQVSVSADATLSAVNSMKSLTQPDIVVDGNTYYLVITSTTLGSTDVALQGAIVYYRASPTA